MRIAIDVDECLCKTLERCLDIMNGRYGTDYTIDNFTEFNIYNCLPAEHAKALDHIFIEKEVWDEIMPYPDAQAAVKKMAQAGHEVLFVSNCHPRTHEWKSDWLTRIYPFVPRENHVYTAKKHVILAEYIIDDNTDWIRMSLATRLLMDRPWNQADYTGYDYRIKNLTEAFEKICEIERMMIEN